MSNYFIIYDMMWNGTLTAACNAKTVGPSPSSCLENTAALREGIGAVGPASRDTGAPCERLNQDPRGRQNMTLFGVIRAPRELVFGAGQREALGALRGAWAPGRWWSRMPGSRTMRVSGL